MSTIVRHAVRVFLPELPLLVVLLAGLWFANTVAI